MSMTIKEREALYQRHYYQKRKKDEAYYDIYRNREQKLETNSYLKRCLKRQGFKSKEITPRLIALKLSEMKARRDLIRMRSKETSTDRSSRAVRDLEDSYIKPLLKQQGFKEKHITKRLIMGKRAQLLFKRELKKGKELINEFLRT